MSWTLDVPSDPPGSSETFRYPPQTSGKFVEGQDVAGAKSIEVVNNSDNYVVLRFDPGGVPVGSAWDLVCPPFVDRVSLFSGDGFTIEADGQGNVPASNHNIMVKTYADRLQPGSYPLPQTQTSSTGIVQVTGTINVGNTPGVNVSNSPTVLQGGSSPWQTGNIREYLNSILVQGTYNALTLVGTQAVKNYQTMLFIGTGQSVTRLQVRGTQTGLIVFDAPITGLQIYPVPLLSAQDTSVDFWVSNGSTAVSMYINIYSISSAGPVLPLTNYGGAPLTVQPASGSSQTVVPGASAAASILTGFSGAPGMSDVGAAFTRPNSIYGLFAAVQASLATPPNYLTPQFCFALKGATSGTTVYLGIVACLMGVPNGGFVGWAGQVNEIFPYPLSAANLWPSDTQLQAQVGAFSGGYTPVAQISLLTS